MIKVLYSPQLNTFDKLKYVFEGEKLTAYLNGMADVFDFSTLPEGRVDSIESDLSIDVVIEAYRKEGILYLKLIKFIGENATKEERFPDWVVI